MDLIINSECDFIPENTELLVSQGNPLLNLLACIGYNASNPPYADLLRQHYRLEGDWLILTPVHWEASHNNAMITDFGQEIDQAEAEYKTLFHAFSDYLREEELALFYHDANTWLLSATNTSLLNAKPVYQILNQPLIHELADIDETMYWQKILTESQMFFTSHALHSQINGAWLWGGGKLTTKKTIKICADEQYKNMAELCSTQVTLYQSSLSLNDFAVLIVNDLSTLSAHHQAQLTKMPVGWYWNNKAYASCSFNWFTRLWRTITHAH